MAYSNRNPLAEPVRSVLRTLARTADPSGRARRLECAYYLAAMWLAAAVTNIAAGAFFDDMFTAQRAAQLVLCVPLTALVARRLHDFGARGWWALAVPLAIALAIPDTIAGAGLDFEARLRFATGWHPLGAAAAALAIACFATFLKEGDVGPNAYGPDPRDDGAAEGLHEAKLNEGSPLDR
jgi:uncharacterized membrane protein YhaH (DUF805 family)